MRTKVLLLACLCTLAIAGAAHARYYYMDLSWDDCGPKVLNKAFAGPGIYSQVVLLTPFDAVPIVGYEIRIGIGPTVADAWRFDGAGCQTGSRISFVQEGGTSCPSLVDPELAPPPTYFYTYDPEEQTAEVFFVSFFDEVAPTVDQRYSLLKINYDHSFSVSGPSRSDSCGGAEQPLKFRATGIVLRSDGLGDPIGPDSIGWNNPCMVMPSVSQVVGRVQGAVCGGESFIVTGEARNGGVRDADLTLTIRNEAGILIKSQVFPDVPRWGLVTLQSDPMVCQKLGPRSFKVEANAADGCGQSEIVTATCATVCYPEQCVSVICSAPDTVCIGQSFAVTASAQNCGSASSNMQIDICTTGDTGEIIIKSESYQNVAAGETRTLATNPVPCMAAGPTAYWARAWVWVADQGGCIVKAYHSTLVAGRAGPCAPGVGCAAPATVCVGEPFTVSGSATNCGTHLADLTITVKDWGGGVLKTQTFLAVPPGVMRSVTSDPITCPSPGTWTCSTTVTAADMCGTVQSGPATCSIVCKPLACADQVTCDAPPAVCLGGIYKVVGSARNCGDRPADLTITITQEPGTTLKTQVFGGVGVGDIRTLTSEVLSCQFAGSTTYTVLVTAANECGSVAAVPATRTVECWEPACPTVTFTDIGAGFPQMKDASAAWGDYDSDGDLDLVLTGATGGSATRLTRVYRNDGGVFHDAGAGLEAVYQGAVAWGDYDNDGNLDLLVTGTTGGGAGAMARVYRNDGGVFHDAGAGLAAVHQGGAAWGDYDNDGDLDILLTGDANPEPFTRIYRNAAAAFSEVVSAIPQVSQSAVAWGDYDNDGDLDLLLAGKLASGSGFTDVFRNLGTGFIPVAAGLPGVSLAAAAWGDYDNDGDLDILLAGHSADLSPKDIARVFRNDDGVFHEIGAELTGVNSGAVAWGDYDNDGDLDILLAGSQEDHTGSSRVYRNEGVGFFTDIGTGLPGLLEGTAAWGDYDNDGDLDILLTGAVDGGRITRIYRSDGAPANTPPTAPVALPVAIEAGRATLKWLPSSDGQTLPSGLSYNLRVGAAPGGSEVASAMSHLTGGYRRLVQLGNTQQRTEWTVSVAPGTYYWSVQAVDGAWAGSPFGPEQSFAIGVVDVAEEAPTEISFALAGANPAADEVDFRFGLPAGARVSLSIYDVSGRRVARLVDGELPAGSHVATWKSREVGAAPGVYFVRFTVDRQDITRRIVVLQ